MDIIMSIGKKQNTPSREELREYTITYFRGIKTRKEFNATIEGLGFIWDGYQKIEKAEDSNEETQAKKQADTLDTLMGSIEDINK